MDVQTYINYFESILNSETPPPPYDKEDKYHYTELNKARHDRWMKKGQLLDQTISTLDQLKEEQHWIVITEPWCGDAAHCLPFIIKMAEVNPLISLEIRLRDSDGSEIDNYLTNGSRSIPKLIVRDRGENDLFTWGARPEPCQSMYNNLTKKGMTSELAKVEVQKWYNADQGKTVQKEICELLNK
jgi:hypothetical protein